MYNRYIPAEASYTAAQPEMHSSGARVDRSFRGHRPVPAKGGLSHLLGSAGNRLKKWDLERFDSGDILILLILLLLLYEGDDWDLVIALAVFLFLEVTEGKKETDREM